MLYLQCIVDFHASPGKEIISTKQLEAKDDKRIVLVSIYTLKCVEASSIIIIIIIRGTAEWDSSEESPCL